jgi:hypothetical protein
MAEMDQIDADMATQDSAESASDDRPESEPEPDGFDYSRLDEEDVEEPVATT